MIPASPKDSWAADSYNRRHSKSQLREEYGFDKDDLLVLVAGSSILYNELSWDYALSIHDIEPLLLKFAGSSDVEERLKFVFVSGNSSDGYNEALQVKVLNAVLVILNFCILFHSLFYPCN